MRMWRILLLWVLIQVVIEMKPNYLQYQCVRCCNSSGSNFMGEQTDLFLLVYCLCPWAVLSGRAGAELCVPGADSPPFFFTAALEATLKILISACFYGRWNRIWVRLKQLKISSFAVDNMWINFRLNWGMQLILSKQRRGWWDFDFSCPCNRIGTGDGAAEVVVCSSFTSELCPPELFSPVVLHLPMVSLLYQSRVWLWPGTFSPCRAWDPLCEQHLILEGREDNWFYKLSVGMLKRSRMGEKEVL